MGLPVVPLDSSNERQHRTVISTTLNELIKRALLLRGDIVRPEDFGPVGTSDDSAVVQAAINTGLPVFLTRRYNCNVTVSTTGQVIFGLGGQLSGFTKAANGSCLTISASHVDIRGIEVIGAGSFTGDNITISDSANNVSLIDVNSYTTSGSCVNAGDCSQLTIRGGLYDNTAAAAGTPVIILGKTGLGAFVLYPNFSGFTAQPSGNPIRLIGVSGGIFHCPQIGGLDIQAGSFSSTVNHFIGNRITGPVDVEGASHTFVGNSVGAHAITFKAGSSDCQWIANNRGAGSTMTNSGAISNIILEIDSGGIPNFLENFRVNNNKNIRMYDSAGTNFSSLGMSSGNNLQLTNNNGAVQVTASAGNPVQLVNQLAIVGDLTPSQITADQDNYNPTNLNITNTLRLSTDASRTITGLAGGVNGRVMFIVNINTNDIVLSNENASSTAGNRFAIGADITLNGGEGVTLKYDSTSARWRCVGRCN